MTRLHVLPARLALILAFAAPFSSAQEEPGFEPETHTLGLPPGAGSKLRAADVTADGTLDAVLLYGQGLSLLHGPSLYEEVDGNAWTTALVSPLSLVQDFAIMPEVGSLYASGVLAVGSSGLDLLTWDPATSAVVSSHLIDFADARHVSSWAAEGSGFTEVAVVEGDGALRTAVLLNSSGALVYVTGVVPLGAPVGDVELLDWDDDGSAELAVLRGTVLEIREAEGSLVTSFPLSTTSARMAVLDYDSSTKDRLALIDRDSQTGAWFLQALDEDGQEVPIALTGSPDGLAAGDHDKDGRPDALISFDTGLVVLFMHQPQGAGSSYDPSDTYEAFPLAPPVPPVNAMALADLDGDGDGDALVADSTSTAWLAYGIPVDAGDWLVGVDGDLSPDEGEEEVTLLFEITLPAGLPGGAATHAAVVTWEGSSQTAFDPSTRRWATKPLVPGQGDVKVEITLPIPGTQTQWNFVAEVRLVHEGPPLHAYPPLWGDVVITRTQGLGGGTLRGTFQPVPPGSSPPPVDD